MVAVLHEYQWLVVVGAFCAFGFGWGTGANDVANAFGTSVGSKTLTLRQAVIIAAIFEFAGALLLGRVSTNVIAGGIADINAFTASPEAYAYGMVCALGVGTLWLIVTSMLGLNVSSTHSIIGGIIGFALIWAGKDGVIWARRQASGAFPPYSGFVAIVLAWFIAPLLTGLASALFFTIIRTVILRRKQALQLSFWLLPIAVLATSWVNVYFVLTKGAKKSLSSSDWSDAKAAWISAVVAGGLAALAACIGIPLLKKWVSKSFDSEGNPIKALPGVTTNDLEQASGSSTDSVELAKVQNAAGAAQPVNAAENAVAEATTIGSKVSGRSLGSWAERAWKMGNHGMTVDIHQVVQTDQAISEIHANAEVFPPAVEYAFRYLQVFSAVCVIFAHGAGEVGYMAGPLATIWDVYTQGKLNRSVQPQIWIILIGALGLVIGLATYGYNVTRAMGVKLAKLTPTRGFSAELATAFVIMIAAQYGLPTSSSQCITGAIVGVGLAEGRGGKGVNWSLFAKQFASWVMTLVVVGLGVAALFAQGVYTPSIISTNAIQVYKGQVGNMSSAMYSGLNTTLYSYREAANAGELTRLTPQEWATLNATVATAARANRNLIDPRVSQTVRPEAILAALRSALRLQQDNSVTSLGQETIYPGAAVCNGNTLALLQDPATLVACAAPRLVNA